MQIASPLSSPIHLSNRHNSLSRFQFGSAPVAGLLSTLEGRPLSELVFKDISAFNAPKIALSRTWKERLDTATLELSNTGITLLSSLALPPLLRPVVSKLSGVTVADLKRELPYALQNKTPQAVKLARLGSSFGFFLPFAASFWAAPFFRNWLTLRRTQSADFESMIGFDGASGNQPKRSLQAEMKHQKNMAWKVFASGVGLGALALTGFGVAARGVANKASKPIWQQASQRLENQWKNNWNWLFEKFDLKGKNAYQIAGGPATLLFWGAPAYLGWIHAARGKNEKRERFVQSGNAIFWFFFAPVLTSWLWHKPFLKVAGSPDLWKKEFLDAIRSNLKPNEQFADKLKSKVTSLSYEDIKHYFQGTEEQRRALVRLKNWKFAVSSLGIPISTLSLVQLINFRVTERKIKEKTMQANPESATLPRQFSVPFQQTQIQQTQSNPVVTQDPVQQNPIKQDPFRAFMGNQPPQTI